MSTKPPRSDKLKALSPQHRIACALKVEGKTHQQIAAAVGVSKAVATRWFSDPLIKAEVERLTEQAVQSILDRRTAVVMTALDTMAARIAAPAGAGEDSLHTAPIEENHRRDYIERALELVPETQTPTEGGGNGEPAGIFALVGALGEQGVRPDQLKQLEEGSRRLLEGKGKEKRAA